MWATRGQRDPVYGRKDFHKRPTTILLDPVLRGQKQIEDVLGDEAVRSVILKSPKPQETREKMTASMLVGDKLGLHPSLVSQDWDFITTKIYGKPMAPSAVLNQYIRNLPKLDNPNDNPPKLTDGSELIVSEPDEDNAPPNAGLLEEARRMQDNPHVEPAPATSLLDIATDFGRNGISKTLEKYAHKQDITEPQTMGDMDQRSYTNMIKELSLRYQRSSANSVAPILDDAAKLLDMSLANSWAPWFQKFMSNIGQTTGEDLGPVDSWSSWMRNRADYMRAGAADPQYGPPKTDGTWQGIKAFVAGSIGEVLPYSLLTTSTALLTGGASASYYGTGGFASGLLQSSGMAGAGGLARTAGMAASGTMTYSIERDNAKWDVIENGGTEAMANLNSDIVGTINAVIEMAQVGGVIRFAQTGKSTRQAIVNSATIKTWDKLKAKLDDAARTGGKVNYALLEEAVGGGIEEALQEATNEMSLQIATDRDVADSLRNIGMAALGGAVGQVALGGLGRTAAILAEGSRVKDVDHSTKAGEIVDDVAGQQATAAARPDRAEVKADIITNQPGVTPTEATIAGAMAEMSHDLSQSGDELTVDQQASWQKSYDTAVANGMTPEAAEAHANTMVELEAQAAKEHAQTASGEQNQPAGQAIDEGGVPKEGSDTQIDPEASTAPTEPIVSTDQQAVDGAVQQAEEQGQPGSPQPSQVPPAPTQGQDTQIDSGASQRPSGQELPAEHRTARQELSRAFAAGEIGADIHETGVAILDANPSLSSGLVMQITDSVVAATDSMLAGEGVDPAGRSFIAVGATTPVNGIRTLATKVAVQLMRGADSTTIVEEFYHGVWFMLSAERQAAYAAYHKESGDSRSVEEHFAQEGMMYFFEATQMGQQLRSNPDIEMALAEFKVLHNLTQKAPLVHQIMDWVRNMLLKLMHSYASQTWSVVPRDMMDAMNSLPENIKQEYQSLTDASKNFTSPLDTAETKSDNQDSTAGAVDVPSKEARPPSAESASSATTGQTKSASGGTLANISQNPDQVSYSLKVRPESLQRNPETGINSVMLDVIASTGAGRIVELMFPDRNFSKFGTDKDDAESAARMLKIIEMVPAELRDGMVRLGKGQNKLAGQLLMNLSSGCGRAQAILSAVQAGMAPREAMLWLTSCHGTCYKNCDTGALSRGSPWAMLLNAIRKRPADKGLLAQFNRMAGVMGGKFTAQELMVKKNAKGEREGDQKVLTQFKLRYNSAPLATQQEIQRLAKEMGVTSAWTPQEATSPIVVTPERAADFVKRINKKRMAALNNAESSFIRNNQQGDWQAELLVGAWQVFARNMIAKGFQKNFSVVTASWYYDLPMALYQEIAAEFGPNGADKLIVQVTGPLDFQKWEADLRIKGYDKMRRAGLRPTLRLISDEYGVGNSTINDPESIRATFEYILDAGLNPEEVLETPLHIDAPGFQIKRPTPENIAALRERVKQLFEVADDEAEVLAQKIIKRNQIFFRENEEYKKGDPRRVPGHTEVGLTYERLSDLGILTPKQAKQLMDRGFFYPYKRGDQQVHGVFPVRCCVTGKCLTCGHCTAIVDKHGMTSNRATKAYSETDAAEVAAITHEGRVANEPAKPVYSVKPIFFSKSERLIEQQMKQAMPADQLRNWLKGKGVKDEEMVWTGLSDLEGKVTPAQALQQIHDHNIQIGEVKKGGELDRTKAYEIEVERMRPFYTIEWDSDPDLSNMAQDPRPGRGHFTWEVSPSSLRPDRWNATLWDTESGDKLEGFVTQLAGNSEAEAKRAVQDYLNESLQEEAESLAREAMPEYQTQYETYALSGGQNYTEMLLTLGTQSTQPKVDIVWSEPKTTMLPRNDLEDEAEEITEITAVVPGVAGGREGRRYTISKIVGSDEYQVAGGGQSRQEWGLYGTLSLAKRAVDVYEARLAGVQYKSSHWQDTPNVLAHVRYDTRTREAITPDQKAEKILFIQEVQSDWHQQGRDRGYGRGPKQFHAIASPRSVGRWGLADDRGDEVQAGPYLISYQTQHEAEEMARVLNETAASGDHYYSKHQSGLIEVQRTGVADAPFKESWPLLVFKRMLRLAVEGGYDSIAWTPGAVQADRYDLRHFIDGLKVSWDGRTHRLAIMREGKIVAAYKLSKPEDAEQYVGKEIAQRIVEKTKAFNKLPKGYVVKEAMSDNPMIMNSFFQHGDVIWALDKNPPRPIFVVLDSKSRIVAIWKKDDKMQTIADAERHEARLMSEKKERSFTMRGLDLEVGGEGMKEFYDKMLPNMYGKYVKPFGASIYRNNVPEVGMSWMVDITEPMKQSVLGGQPLWQVKPKVVEKLARTMQEMDRPKGEVNSEYADKEKPSGQPPDKSYAVKPADRKKVAARYLEDARTIMKAFSEKQLDQLMDRAAAVFQRGLPPEAAILFNAEYVYDDFIAFLSGRKNTKTDPVYDKFRKWLHGIYNELKGAGAVSVDPKVDQALRYMLPDKTQLHPGEMTYRDFHNKVEYEYGVANSAWLQNYGINPDLPMRDEYKRMQKAFRATEAEILKQNFGADTQAAIDAQTPVSAETKAKVAEAARIEAPDLFVADAKKMTIASLLNSIREDLIRVTKARKALMAAYAAGEAKGELAGEAKGNERLERFKLEVQAAKARAQTKEYVKKLVRSIMKPVSAAVDIEYREAIETIQAAMDPSFRSSKTLQKRAKLLAFAQANPTAKIPEHLLKLARKKSVGQWTVTDLEAMAWGVKEMRKLGKMKMDLKREARARELQAAIDRIKETLSKAKPPPADREPSPANQKRPGIASRLLKGARASTLRPARLADLLDGGKGTYAGTAHQYLIDLVNAAMDEEIRQKDRRTQAAVKFFAENGLSVKDLMKNITVIDKKFTVCEVVGIYTRQKNMRSRLAMLHGNGITKEQMAFATHYVENVDPRLYKLSEWVLQEYEANYSRLDDAYIRDKNQRMVKEPNYTSIRRLLNLDTLPEDMVLAEQFAEMRKMKKIVAEHGMTIPRKDIPAELQTEIYLDLYQGWLMDVGRQEHYIATVDANKKINRILHDPELSKMIRERLGEDYLSELRKYAERVANPNSYHAYDGMEAGCRALRRNAAIAVLTFNLTTLMKQPISLLSYLVDAGPQELLISFAQFMANPFVVWNRVRDLDPQLKHQAMEQVLDEISQSLQVIQSANPVIGAMQRMRQPVVAAGMTAMSFMDGLARTIGWNAVYNRAIKDRVSEEEAIRQAQGATLRTQSASAAKDLPGIYTKNEYLTSMLMFTNELNQMYNLLSYDLPASIKNKDVGRVFCILLAAGMAQVFLWSISNRRPPEDKDDLLAIAGNATFDPIPVVGPMIMTATKPWKTNDTPPVKMMKNLIKTGDEVMEGDYAKAMMPAFEALAMYYGIPYLGPKKFATAAMTGEPAAMMGGPSKKSTGLEKAPRPKH